MLSFDPVLKHDHVSILESLKKLELSWKSRQPDDCVKYAAELLHLIKQHHENEWHQLFSKFVTSSELNQGGPFCAYFYDAFIINRPREKASQLLKSCHDPEIMNMSFQIPDTYAQAFNAKSMISVPLEEHISIQTILEALVTIQKNWSSMDQKWFDKSLEFLADLIRKNIEKEETCLWLLINQSCHLKRQ